MDPDTAFDMGKQAAADGKAPSANPYEQGSEQYEEWIRGFEFVDEFDEDGQIPTDA
jgi:hypothetical protein